MDVYVISGGGGRNCEHGGGDCDRNSDEDAFGYALIPFPGRRR